MHLNRKTEVVKTCVKYPIPISEAQVISIIFETGCELVTITLKLSVLSPVFYMYQPAI